MTFMWTKKSFIFIFKLIITQKVVKKIVKSIYKSEVLGELKYILLLYLNGLTSNS